MTFGIHLPGNPLPAGVGRRPAPAFLRTARSPVSSIHQEKPMAIEAINARNQFRGTIKEIVSGPVVSEVLVETPHGTVASVVTTRSINELRLAVGSEVLALVKATEVSLAKV